MFGEIAQIVWMVVLTILKIIGYGLLISFVYNTIKMLIKTKGKLTEKIKNYKYPWFMDFAKWKGIDLYRKIRYKKDGYQLFGITAFTGYYGQGKTLGCVLHAKKIQRDHPSLGIKIYSNIDIKGQEGELKRWEDILDLPPYSIVIYDECQSDWSCNLGKSAFPEEFLRRLTMCRKKNLALYITSPVYTRLNINIRESIEFVVDCKNYWGRLFTYRYYRTPDYERCIENDEKLRKKLYDKEKFVVSDAEFEQYDTAQLVESMKDVIDGDAKLRNEMAKKEIASKRKVSALARQ